MNELVKQIALQVGGSHYPDVGGKLLEKTVELVVKECIDAVSNADCRNIVYTTFDLGMEQSVKAKCVESIKERFK